MNRGIEFCAKGTCPTIIASAEGTGAVVQGYKTGDPSAVMVPQELLGVWKPSVDAVVPGGTIARGLSIKATSESATVLVQGTPVEAKRGSVPSGEGLVFLPKADLAAQKGQLSRLVLADSPRGTARVA